MPRASVIVPARESGATLGRTLEALAHQDLDDDYEVIVVVDDASRDDTGEVAASAPGPVTVVHQHALGVAKSRNLGVAHARSPALAFCDADVFPTPGWLRAGVQALARAELVQGKVLPDPSQPLGPFDRSLWITGQVGLWETANLFVSREMFDRVGGFEQVLSPFQRPFGEDVWFASRVLRLGARPAFCTEALAHHAVFRRDWRDYAGERWRLFYFPALAAKAPELRHTMFYRRVFLSRRTAALDLGLAGAILAAGTRSPLPLLASLPYLRMARKHSQRTWPTGPRSVPVTAADGVADLIALVAMAAGSVRYRSLVI